MFDGYPRTEPAATQVRRLWEDGHGGDGPTFSLSRALAPTVLELRGAAELAKPPRYVDACASGSWMLALVPVGGGPGRLVPYRCRSRRHAGPCATSWRRELYCRTRDGELATADPGNVYFITWTLQAEYHRGTVKPPEHWTSADWRRERRRREVASEVLTAAVSEHMRTMNQRRRRAGLPRLSYLWVVEAHRSGVPHAHAVVHEPLLSAREWSGLSRAEPSTAVESSLYPDGDDAWVPSAWADAKPTAIGRMGIEPARNQGAVASYLAKIAGEVSKGQGSDRLALSRHQRTYGASRGFLAPRKSGDKQWTGALVNRHGACVSRAARGTRARDVQSRLVVAMGETIDWSTGEVNRAPAAVTLLPRTPVLRAGSLRVRRGRRRTPAELFASLHHGHVSRVKTKTTTVVVALTAALADRRRPRGTRASPLRFCERSHV